MEQNKNQTTIIVLLTLIIGLIVGYFFGGNGMMGNSWSFSGNHMYGDEIIDSDGAMIHAMDEMMLAFRGKEGSQYDELFLRSMIVHHLGGIRMSESVIENTDRPELQAFAQEIINTQSDEVEQMRSWLEEWFDKNN